VFAGPTGDYLGRSSDFSSRDNIGLAEESRVEKKAPDSLLESANTLSCIHYPTNISLPN
jgi:hypothetical protein